MLWLRRCLQSLSNHQEAPLERREQKYEFIKKADQQNAREPDMPGLHFHTGKKACVLISPDYHRLSQTNHKEPPMHKLNKVSNVSASAPSARTTSWSVLNFIEFIPLSLWIAGRGLCQGIGHRMRRK